jgi:hypothetical protein
MLQVHLAVTAKQTRFKGILRNECGGICVKQLALLETCLEYIDNDELIGFNGSSK